MNKRFALIMVMLMITAALLSACSSDSKNAGKDYIEAVIKGEQAAAEAFACDSFNGTPELVAFFRDDVKARPDTVDLKVDLGKANNQKELRITGSVDCERTATAENCSTKNQYVFSEKKGTLIILEMKKQDGDWCVTGESVFEGTPLDTTADTEAGEGDNAEDVGETSEDAAGGADTDAGAGDTGTSDADDATNGGSN
jgi:predicted small secreted protein